MIPVDTDGVSMLRTNEEATSLHGLSAVKYHAQDKDHTSILVELRCGNPHYDINHRVDSIQNHKKAVIAILESIIADVEAMPTEYGVHTIHENYSHRVFEDGNTCMHPGCGTDGQVCDGCGRLGANGSSAIGRAVIGVTNR